MADSQVDEVKRQTDIVSLIDARIKLTRAGRNLKALCPFHGEKSPSFFVSPEMQTFKCFGCGKSGDAFSFLQEFEGMTFPEALEYLAGKAGITLKKEYRSDEEQRRERLFALLHLAQEYYHYLLTEHAVGKKARDYLASRGISAALQKTFGLGYAPEAWENLQKFLVGRKKYTPDELLATGLVIGRASGGSYDRFRGRVMFPLKDSRGRTVGFSGRVLPGVDEKGGPPSPTASEGQAKYINTPETPLYHKRELLFGLYEARQAIKQKDRVVVVEGELDMIRSFSTGVKEVVAIKGSALTAEQVDLLHRFTANVVLALDADTAGSEATKRGIAVADKAGLNLSVAVVTDAKDPDELIGKDPGLWRKLVNTSVSVYDFLIDRTFAVYDATTGEGKRKISREAAGVLAQIANAVEREHYVRVVAQKLGVSERVVEEEVVKAGVHRALGSTSEIGRGESPADSQLGGASEPGRRESLERYMAALFLQLTGRLDEAVRALAAATFVDPAIAKFWHEIGQIVAQKPEIRMKELLESLPAELQRLAVDLFTQDVVFLEADKVVAAFFKAVDELGGVKVRDTLGRLNQEIAQLEDKKELTADEQATLTRLQEEYRRVSQRMSKT